ncbi:Cof-type HAD-IIB family hydrolase [Ligilactobacillus cholophilus]|uniref:Cof-type HAD-IIB family hydrolase n=1 Tax=Ligilactobacillus cholophilus TaxID=3050131 RepID=UPI0025B04F5D|nr:Cof-type HAD-IIB family hydrolase [Ligilactobacillus cholophilus]
MIQIIASDMDGTLLNGEMTVSSFNANAIKAAQEKGVHFIVSSGRSYYEVKPLLDKFGIKCPMISINGGLILDENGNTIESTPIPKELASQIMTTLKKAHLYFEVVTKDGVCSDDKSKRIENFAELLASIQPDTPFKLAVSLASARMELVNIQYVDDYQEILSDVHNPIYKIVAFSQDGPKVLDPLREKFDANPELVVTSSGERNIEINHANATKGIALQKYADSLNIPLDNVMAIGDNNNDVPMLKVAGVSYAMGNGTDEVKKIANHIADTNFNDGVGKAILQELN